MVEKWIFRAILAVITLLFVVITLGSLDDIRRYLRIRRM